MKATGKFCVVLVTTPSMKVARNLAQKALGQKLLACANLIPKVESHYRWRGKVESNTEVLMLCKTTRPRLPAFKEFILAHHPYDTPEFVILELLGGEKRYLSWIEQSVAP